MRVLFGIIAIWVLVAILDYAKYGYAWQLKEYRWRNMRDYLRSKRGRQLVFNPLAFRQGIARPRFTVKIILILLGSLSIEVLIIYFWKYWWVVILLLLFRFLIVSGVVVLMYIPTMLFKRWYIYLATAKLKKYKNLKVIGVTGSYGKTTVKEILAQVLSTKFLVIKTPEYINTEIGIARFILQEDFSKVQVFIVEMGAYNPGDIKIIAEMVRPQVGILTAINEQHLSLFGSLKKIQSTKYELLNILPANGLAIVNADCVLCMEFLNKLKSLSVTFGVKHPAQYQATNLTSNIFGIKFQCNNLYYESLLIGQHNIINILPAIIVAEKLGMSANKIQQTIKRINLPLSNSILKKLGKAQMINDSYNANPDGFLAMLDLLKDLKKVNQKVIVITRGINELGEESAKKHRLIGKYIAEVADVLVIISPDYEEYLRIGAGETMLKIKTIFNGNELLQYIKELEKTDSLILFANKLFSNVDYYLRTKDNIKLVP